MTEDDIRDTLTRYIPMFRQRMDQAAGDLIGNLESLIEHQLWQRAGFETLSDYALQQLGHSEAWVRGVIRVYRKDWTREQQAAGTVGDLHRDYSRLVDELAPATTLSEAMKGNSNASKGKENSGDNITAESKPKRKAKRGTDPEYVIARLKRDKADDDLPADVRERACGLLADIESGDIKPSGRLSRRQSLSARHSTISCEKSMLAGSIPARWQRRHARRGMVITTIPLAATLPRSLLRSIPKCL
jgi:hypothetical protein